jgi:hypothetical protein
LSISCENMCLFVVVIEFFFHTLTL